jgi:hypothetical protein
VITIRLPASGPDASDLLRLTNGPSRETKKPVGAGGEKFVGHGSPERFSFQY